MKQCEYCGKEITYHEIYCCDDCQIKANRFYERCEKFSKLFTAVNTACVFGIPVGLFLMSFLRLLGTVVASGSCIILGLMLLLFPFPTEGMIKKFKIIKAVKIVRILGIAVIVLGLFIAGMLVILGF
ncbi:hypothetical protein [Lachnoclostridium sp. MSJ-17]|uniref:hypothetical protein n=1 Tax=Lachnoclostridium sp. MSJ-17 TaxID=2841516 RepID=UPI001C0FC171|nr:hypothetical protein [Lachnoclostridium sp. MSJ-17]MBU5462837.1 hypothetical protein [Lachnoclostridium sp. MSJ-17]